MIVVMNPTDPIKSKRVPRFVEEYCKHSVGTRAALSAGWPASWAHVAASRLLQNANVQDLIAEERARISKIATIEAVDVLRLWLDVATADPSKLQRVRRVNCRHCWGVGHEYQWAAREYAEACDRALSTKPAPKPAPECPGGFGWVSNAEPCPDCPECNGEGVESVYIADIETLTGPERALYAGVKMTTNGPEVKMHDQAAARENIAKYLGMMVDKREITGKGGAPLMPTSIIVCGPDE